MVESDTKFCIFVCDTGSDTRVANSCVACMKFSEYYVVLLEMIIGTIVCNGLRGISPEALVQINKPYNYRNYNSGEESNLLLQTGNLQRLIPVCTTRT
jgi:hypothetical protein